MVEAGSAEPKTFAPGADLRHDLPKYRVYRYGELEAEETDISDYWQDDMVSFLLGCSFTFDNALMRSGVSLRHVEQDAPRQNSAAPLVDATVAGALESQHLLRVLAVPHASIVPDVAEGVDVGRGRAVVVDAVKVRRSPTTWRTI